MSDIDQYSKNVCQKAKDALSSLSVSDRQEAMESIYTYMRYEHIKEDVKSQMEEDERFEDMSDYEYDDLAERCALRYAYDGDYDCNLAYWDNIHNLINEELENQKGAER